ncbi:MAG: peptidoglycan bridge formation glycyltransferase FemA/FemB family protein [Chitinivibrionales bacterium]|nr:peptidoglycan bridge formation glycyltransferase FemA/FemB family protein [Chitinivibrionales bacterium]
MFTLPSSYSCTILPLSQHEWSSILSQFCDASLYQTWEYGSVRWGKEFIEHIVLKKDESIVAAAQVRLMKLPLIPVRLAYITWGPLWKTRNQKPDPHHYRLILSALKNHYFKKKNFSFIIIIPNGFMKTDADLAAIARHERFRKLKLFFSQNRRTIVIDLSKSEEELRKRLDKKWRYSLKCSEKETIRIVEGFDDTLFQTFVSLYNELKEQKGFAGVNCEQFARMQSLFEPHNRMRVTIGYHNDHPVSGSVCTLIGDNALGIMNATNAVGRKMLTSFLMQWDMILWAKKNGAKGYDLSGINRLKNPSVYHFKAGLNGDEQTLVGVYCQGKNLLYDWIILAAQAAKDLIGKLSAAVRADEKNS